MNIITVIPLTRAKVASSLSYFTSSDVTVGAVVTVPLRSKSINAIVTEVRSAEDLKSEIKKAPYEIKKLAKIKTTTFFPISFIDSCKLLADHYASTTGAIIDTLVADILQNNTHKIKSPIKNEVLVSSKKLTETYAIQGDTADRYSSWRSLIRQNFARKKSIAIYVPTIAEAQKLFNVLEKGIEGYIFMLHSNLPNKKILETWETVANNSHPVVIIATGSFLLLPRTDIETVIIENENGRGWISQKSPYIDIRHALEVCHKAEQRTVYLADSLLRVETLNRLNDQEIQEGTPFKWRSVSTANDSLIDMKSYKSKENNFRVISPELENLIINNKENNTHLFILALRRGTSPSTVCADCEKIVTCNNCSSPMVLHTSKESGRNFFMCHNCGERRSANETCSVCDSWRLTPLGVGIDLVQEEIKSRCPDVDIFKIDIDTTDTSEKAEQVLNNFLTKPGSVLIGTEMAFNYLPEKMDHVAIVSLDSLFALPDFRIQEKIMYILIKLRNMATRSIVVQTRLPEENVFEYGLKGNLSDFYRAILDDRRKFMYPPFGTLIKISIEGKKDMIANQMADIQKILDPHSLDIFPAFTASVRGNSIIHGLIKLLPHTWPDQKLLTTLRNLPISITIKVNPESLL